MSVLALSELTPEQVKRRQVWHNLKQAEGAALRLMEQAARDVVNNWFATDPFVFAERLELALQNLDLCRKELGNWAEESDG